MKKLFSTNYSANSFTFAMLLLRVFAGLAIAFNHGYGKLTGYNQILAKGFMDPFHIGASASLSLVIFAEFFCGILVALGLLTRLACIPLIITMIVAFFIAHNGSFKEGEMAGLYLVAFTTILLVGPGKASVDRLIGK